MIYFPHKQVINDSDLFGAFFKISLIIFIFEMPKIVVFGLFFLAIVIFSIFFFDEKAVERGK